MTPAPHTTILGLVGSAISSEKQKAAGTKAASPTRQIGRKPGSVDLFPLPHASPKTAQRVRGMSKSRKADGGRGGADRKAATKHHRGVERENEGRHGGLGRAVSRETMPPTGGGIDLTLPQEEWEEFFFYHVCLHGILSLAWLMRSRGLAGMAGKDTKVLALAPGGLLPRWCQGRGRAASTRSSCRGKSAISWHGALPGVERL